MMKYEMFELHPFGRICLKQLLVGEVNVVSIESAGKV